MGYGVGLREGRNQGQDTGYWDGRNEVYDDAYRPAYKSGQRKADREMHHANGRALTIENQFSEGIRLHSRGKYTQALRRFNLILMEESSNTSRSFKPQALWYAGDIHMKEGYEKEALSIFILHSRNNPRDMEEDTALNIALLLLEVKTGGFIGIGSTKYYDKCKGFLNFWIDSYSNSQRMAEALYTLGQVNEKLKLKSEAKAVYKEIVNNYSNSQFAKKAKKRLKKLNSFWSF
jgi:outer membrane protein assembly factor BamD (BamD/ComL family)